MKHPRRYPRIAPLLPLTLALACSTAEPIKVDSGVQGDVADASRVTGDPDAAVFVVDAAPADALVPIGVDAAVPGPDASTCATTPCDLIEQCGCAGGEACDLDAADPLVGNDCRAVNSPGTETSSCAAASDCAAGYTCINDGAGGAACKPYCDPAAGNDGCEGPRGQCVIQLTSGGTEIPGAVMCSSNCDPTRASAGGCPAGTGCFIYVVDPDGTADSGDEVDIADCSTAGTSVQDDFCVGYEDCAPDHLCLDTGLVLNQCLRICDTIGSTCAAQAGKTCTGFADPAVVGGTEYGVCF